MKRLLALVCLFAATSAWAGGLGFFGGGGSAFDASVDLDLTATGGSTSDGDLTVAGYAQFNGTAEFNGLLDVDAGLTMATGQVATIETITAVDADGVTIKGYTGDADLLKLSDASATRFAITTTAGAGAITLTFTDAADAATITYDHDATAEFVVNHAWEALEIDSATFGAADGTNAFTVADSTGAVTFANSITLSNNQDIKIATDGGSDIGASGKEVGTLWVKTIDNAAADISLAANVTCGGNIGASVFDASVGVKGPYLLSESTTDGVYSVRVQNDTDSGIYTFADKSFQWRVDGTAALSVGATGSVTVPGGLNLGTATGAAAGAIAASGAASFAGNASFATGVTGACAIGYGSSNATSIVHTWTDTDGHTVTMTVDDDATYPVTVNHGANFVGATKINGSIESTGDAYVGGVTYVTKFLAVDSAGNGSESKITMAGALADADGNDNEALVIRADNTSGVYDRLSFWGSNGSDDDSVEMLELSTASAKFCGPIYRSGGAGFLTLSQSAGSPDADSGWYDVNNKTIIYKIDNSNIVQFSSNLISLAQQVMAAKSVLIDKDGSGHEAYVSYSGTAANNVANNDRARVQMCQADGDTGQTTGNLGLAFVGTPTPGNVAASVSMGYVTTAWSVPVVAAAPSGALTTATGAHMYCTGHSVPEWWNGANWTDGAGNVKH